MSKVMVIFLSLTLSGCAFDFRDVIEYLDDRAVETYDYRDWAYSECCVTGFYKIKEGCKELVQ